MVAAGLLTVGSARAEEAWMRDAFKSAAAEPLAAKKQSGGDKGSPKATGDATAKAKEKEAQKKLRPDLKPGRPPWQWRITKAAWDSEDDSGYEDFIRTIGESDCTTVHACLTSATANPRFHLRQPRTMSFFADCADLPFILRGYYAWQSGLPFSFSVRLGTHVKTPGHASRLRGTQVIDRYDIVGPGPDPRLALPAIYQFVSSEHFRTPPAYVGKMLADHYPVSISRESIRPGTVIFDPDGHIAVVYKVTEDGRIHYIDAHPDNSLTRGIFNREFSRAEPPMGAGFKRWRPQRLEGAKNAPDGSLIGGRIVLTADRDLKDWSDEQFFGTQAPRPDDWKNSVFEVAGLKVDYHDFVRMRLAGPDFKYEPLGETRSMLRQLCTELKYRVTAVELATKAGFDRRPQPDRLPDNIYATKGDWEVYSTPSRDARIRTAFEETRDEIYRFLKLNKDGSGILNYTGQSLRAELLAIYREEAAACSITYTKSDGAAVTLGFDELKRRLYNMSFDPYHCIELRWGADDAAELASCQDSKVKRDWYEAEARLRNQLVRTYGEKMGWSLAQLQDLTADIGISDPPDIDPLNVLLNESYQIAAKSEVGVARGERGRPQR